MRKQEWSLGFGSCYPGGWWLWCPDERSEHALWATESLTSFSRWTSSHPWQSKPWAARRYAWNLHSFALLGSCRWTTVLGYEVLAGSSSCPLPRLGRSKSEGSQRWVSPPSWYASTTRSCPFWCTSSTQSDRCSCQLEELQACWSGEDRSQSFHPDHVGVTGVWRSKSWLAIGSSQMRIPWSCQGSNFSS